MARVQTIAEDFEQQLLQDANLGAALLVQCLSREHSEEGKRRTGVVLRPVLLGDGHEGQDDGGVDQVAQALVAEDQHHRAPAEVLQALVAVGALAGRAGCLRAAFSLSGFRAPHPLHNKWGHLGFITCLPSC